MSGNIFEGRDDLTRDNYAALDFKRWLKPYGNYAYAGTLADWKSDAPAELGGALPKTQSALEAAELVLAHAGASLRRDAVDARVVDDVRHRRGKVIDSQREVGGFPALRTVPALADTDRDGMADAWEVAQGLDPKNPADRNGTRENGGYTNLERYLASLVR